MPRQTLSQAAFREMFAQESAEVFLLCVTITHSSLTDPIRMVYNNQPITRLLAGVGNVVFNPAVFQIALPPETTDRLPSVSMTIDNVDRSISDALRTITGRANLTLEVVLASTPNYVEAGPFEFALMSCVYNAQQVTGTLGVEADVLNSEFPRLKYTPSTSPGLFR